MQKERKTEKIRWWKRDFAYILKVAILADLKQASFWKKNRYASVCLMPASCRRNRYPDAELHTAAAETPGLRTSRLGCCWDHTAHPGLPLCLQNLGIIREIGYYKWNALTCLKSARWNYLRPVNDSWPASSELGRCWRTCSIWVELFRDSCINQHLPFFLRKKQPMKITAKLRI